MSGDGKRLAEAVARAKAEGLEVVEVAHSKHVRLTVRAPDGRTKKFSMAISPSRHFEAKQRAEFRRFAQSTT